MPQRSHISALVPGGIRNTDYLHIHINDGTCSRCRKVVPEEDVPLLLWSGDVMLIYARPAFTSRRRPVSPS